MKSGNIFIDKEGTEISRIGTDDRNRVLREYYVMRDQADANDDRFFFINAKEWEDFFSNLWSPENPYWKGVDMNFITSLQNGSYPQKMIDDISEFDKLPEPRSHGGYGYDDHPSTGYVCNTGTWDEWHHRWNLARLTSPEELYNGVWPRFDKTTAILKAELEAAGENAPAGASETVNAFHEHIKHLDERERISLSKRIGAEICEANYYHREEELEKLEKDYGNNHAELIYSIKIGPKYQFLSIDKQHGMMELCDDKGDHQMEIRLDGTKNKDKEPDHSLRCVMEWKQKYHK